MVAGDFPGRFVCLTFDDGYRDNLEFAYPILKRHAVPFTLYVPSAFADGRGELWWVWLERAIAALDTVDVPVSGTMRHFDCATPTAKDETFRTVYWALRELGDEAEMRAICRDLAIGAGIDADAVCRELCMGWEELKELATDPLVTIGAHTDTHIMLAKAPEEIVRQEMRTGAERIEAMLGVRPAHFSYPVGDPGCAGRREFEIAEDLGFATAVTTRPGVLFADHARHLTALPRISVNGEFQRLRYLDVLLSGAPTALMNRFRRVDAA